jgi:hypothetical protein
MKTMIFALLVAFVGLMGAPVLVSDGAPAYAQSRDALRAKCKRMLKQSYGLQRGETRRGGTGGRAGAYYTQIEACAANGGRL